MFEVVLGRFISCLDLLLVAVRVSRFFQIVFKLLNVEVVFIPVKVCFGEFKEFLAKRVVSLFWSFDQVLQVKLCCSSSL